MRPTLLMTEAIGAIFTTKEHPEYIAALAKRGITEPRRRADRPVAGRRVRLRLRGRPAHLALHLVPARPTRPTTATRARSKASSCTSTWRRNEVIEVIDHGVTPLPPNRASYYAEDQPQHARRI